MKISSGLGLRRTVGAALLAVMLVASAVFTMPGALAQDVEAEPAGSVRFLHASPDAPAVDIILDGVPVTQGLEFGGVTEFAAVPPGEHQVQIVPAGEGTNAALIDETFDVDSDEAYTVAVANLLNELEVVVVQSNITELPEEDLTRIRAVNLSPDLESVDLYQVGGDELLGGIDFKEASEHYDLGEGSYDLEFRPSGENEAVVAVPALTIVPGNEMTLFLVGRAADNTLAVIPLVVEVQAPCSTTLGIGDIAEDACVRIVHAAVDAQSFDIYIEDGLVVEALDPGTTSAFFTVPAGDGRSVKLVPAGGSLDEALVESSVDFNERGARSVVIGGASDDLKVINETVNLSPVPANQSRIRAINVSHDADGLDFVVGEGDPLFGDVGFENFTDHVIVDAGTYDLQVRAAGENDVRFRATDFEIEPGQVYTLIAAGSVENGTFTVLSISVPASVRTGAVAVVTPNATPGVATESAEELEEMTPTPLSEAETIEAEATPTS
jgi:hypothetical protein